MTIPDLFTRLCAYDRANPDNGGALHLYLSDGNAEAECLEECYRFALQEQDAEGALLAGHLLGLTEAERVALLERVREANPRPGIPWAAFRGWSG